MIPVDREVYLILLLILIVERRQRKNQGKNSGASGVQVVRSKTIRTMDQLYLFVSNLYTSLSSITRQCTVSTARNQLLGNIYLSLDGGVHSNRCESTVKCHIQAPSMPNACQHITDNPFDSRYTLIVFSRPNRGTRVSRSTMLGSSPRGSDLAFLYSQSVPFHSPNSQGHTYYSYPPSDLLPTVCSLCNCLTDSAQLQATD